MELRVNGELVRLEEPSSIRHLLDRYELGRAPCAVEVNATLVPWREHERHLLRDGDVVEIVTLVGGG
jgi:thiamine biosynthesis protein ThiS